ncbi:hypothetical protein NDU88_002854 [Pleurodeles waltl]|uniref:Uncharacterized protein n=1 Tax=Pleurodeles waltl TaxID=8319 RepID=A0AAV7TMA0_PLEWA|nr:hypothetical protein NDU88_002854 [Pleurodeles waltl]
MGVQHLRCPGEGVGSAGGRGAPWLGHLAGARAAEGFAGEGQASVEAGKARWLQPGGRPWKTNEGAGPGERWPPLMTGGGAENFPLNKEREHGGETERPRLGPGGNLLLHGDEQQLGA